MNTKSFSKNLFVSVTLLGGAILGTTTSQAAKPAAPLETRIMACQGIPDTVYTRQVTSNVLREGEPVAGANIKYTLIDTVNDTQKLVREAFTDELGQDIADSLPVLKHYTGLQPFTKQTNRNNLLITNNGTGSNHLIRFKTDAKDVSQEAYITNMLGQEIAKILVRFNPSTKTYDAVWNGEHVDQGVYLFHAKTGNKSLAGKIVHVEGRPTTTDFSAELKETSQEKNKSFKSVTEGDLGVSKYAINITHESLEDFVDTVWLQEDTQHEFFFNANTVQYEDGNIQAIVRFEENGGMVGFAHAKYKQLLDPSQIFEATANQSGAYVLTVPVVYEATNPGQTRYEVTLTPTTVPFVELIDTLLISPGLNQLIHNVNQIIIEPTQDIEGIIRHVYTKLPESGVIIRAIDRTTGELIEEQTTSADGKYFFADFPEGTLLEFVLGKPGELWMCNNEYDVPEEIIDTLVTFNRYFYPKILEIPKLGANDSLEVSGLEIREMVGYDLVNFEEILRHADYMFANPNAVYWAARDTIANQVYEGDSPILTAGSQRNITPEMQQSYEPYTNFYPGLLGWNVQFGSGNHTTAITTTTNYGVTAILGGEIMTTSGGTNYLSPILKELLGRRLHLGSVYSRPSMMNSNPALLNEKDRAIINLILLNQKGRFKNDEETYSLEFITSEEPSKNYIPKGIVYKESLISGAQYKDIPGNKPHCKQYFNKNKFQEQQQSKRQDQIKRFIHSGYLP